MGEEPQQSPGCLPAGTVDEDDPATWETLLFPGRERPTESRTAISDGRPVSTRARDARLRRSLRGQGRQRRGGTGVEPMAAGSRKTA